SLVASGLPLEHGLRAAARELPRGRVAKALVVLADKLNRGEKLDEALSAGGRSLPPHLTALITGGLRSASLARVLTELVAAERHSADVMRRIMLAVSYPALLLLMMSLIFGYFCIAVVPSLMEVYEDFDADLPAATMALGELSRSGVWMLAGNIAVLAASWLFVWAAMRTAELRALLVFVPLLGPVIRWAALARYSRLLALLVEVELPLPQALDIAGRGCEDASLRYASQKVAAGVQSGRALSDALMARREFPDSMGPMVRWGEQAAGTARSTSALADALRTAAEMFEGRVETQLGLLRAVVPPLAFLFVLWGAAFLMSASLLPMVSLIEKLT
ncbi:MAG TPA: type II secretion system F family protein, partial [Pirellulales bacterium]|nr:type II secretion system F family protein [Pirellulales bacterium]